MFLAAQALKIIGGVDYIAMSHMDRLYHLVDIVL
jgi:hypothetical protein